MREEAPGEKIVTSWSRTTLAKPTLEWKVLKTLWRFSFEAVNRKQFPVRPKK
jgi:hypothetical protein